MNIVTSAILGLIFLGLGLGATFLMYYLWGFPFDKATRTSAAPKRLMGLHRAIGYAYGILYIIMMLQMVPRMWQYQVELPPRTVAHLMLGILIGIILIVKIAITRFYRHLEEWMPYLGTALLTCTVLLLGLSLPFVFRERALASEAVGGSVFSVENRQRVARLLRLVDVPPRIPLADLSTIRSLSAGRSVLLEKCVRCHDLKTSLERPRTPSDWVSTIGRMAGKPAPFTPISEQDQWHVAAYLMAITPDPQTDAKDQHDGEIQVQTQTASEGLNKPSIQNGHTLFAKNCAACHGANAQGGEGPDLRSLKQSDQSIISTIKGGIKGEMPSFGARFKDSELRDLVAYLRSLKK